MRIQLPLKGREGQFESKMTYPDKANLQIKHYDIILHIVITSKHNIERMS